MLDPTQPNWMNTTFYLCHFRLFTSLILVHALLTGENLNNVKTNLISPFQLRNCKIMSKLHDWEVLTHTHIYMHGDISISRSKSTLVKVCLFLDSNKNGHTAGGHVGAACRFPKPNNYFSSMNPETLFVFI
ncbi:hypothetical protein GOODEAATRI_015671 [Goodea atripinnis]|uniref:Uncharacterized protein n=1 Tax=Goodea atripinnis TaxID=208336 RepID=A0ABV0MSC2_9TELE